MCNHWNNLVICGGTKVCNNVKIYIMFKGCSKNRVRYLFTKYAKPTNIKHPLSHLILFFFFCLTDFCFLQINSIILDQLFSTSVLEIRSYSKFCTYYTCTFHSKQNYKHSNNKQKVLELLQWMSQKETRQN